MVATNGLLDEYNEKISYLYEYLNNCRDASSPPDSMELAGDLETARRIVAGIDEHYEQGVLNRSDAQVLFDRVSDYILQVNTYLLEEDQMGPLGQLNMISDYE